MTDLPIEPQIDAERVSEDNRLDSWKEIAAFLKKDVRTVQRWEKVAGLPVRRYSQDKAGGVFAYKSEIDEWLRSQQGRPLPPGPAPGDEEDEDSTETDDDDNRGNGWTQAWRYAALVILVAVLAVVAYRWFARPAHKLKVMVRNLQTLSQGGADDAFSQGMTDELITDLGRANPEQLGVLARTTADLYSKKTISELRGLGVDYVIEGSVFRDRDEIRINTQLIDTRDGTQLSAKSYEGASKSVLDLQRTAADDIVVSLKLPLRTRPQPRQVIPPAYDAYVEGRFAWNQRGQYSVANSINKFKKAVDLDPNFAPAYAGLADAYALLASAQYGILPPVEGFAEAKQFAERSIALDPELAAPHASLGYIYLVFERNPESARKEFEKALQLDPNYTTAHQWYGQYYEVIGRLDDAVREIEKAHEREPASIPVNLAMAEVYYFKRDYDRAIGFALTTVRQENTSALGHFNLGRAYEMKGLHNQAIDEFKLARENAPNIATLVPLAYEYARAGDMTTSTDYLNQLVDLAERQHKYVPAIYFTVAYTGRNDKENALTWLAKANQERCDYIVFLSRDPMVDPLRGDPRFEAIANLHNP